jgi:hypothetical protein
LRGISGAEGEDRPAGRELTIMANPPLERGGFTSFDRQFVVTVTSRR